MKSNFDRVKEVFDIGTTYCKSLGLFVSVMAQTDEELQSMLKGLQDTQIANTRLNQLFSNSQAWVGIGCTEERALAALKKRLNEIDSKHLIAEVDTVLPQLGVMFLEIVGHDFHY